jgi:PBSX family phage terminase large subunit
MYSRQVQIKPFSKKYIDYYTRCFTSRVNCLEGAYRAGKSVINIFSFANHIDNCKDKIHLVSGASAATARLNVSDCNGLGLQHIFRGRCTSGKYEGNECLKIKSQTGEKIVIFVGGGQSDSYKKIQGLSFGSWLSVELANLYISDDEKNFIDMALSRLTQSKDQKVWWDLNPTFPTHKVYIKYLDKYEKMQDTGEFFGGYNFMKCSLFDNTALSDEQRQGFLSLYPDKESVEYQRYIIGNRAVSEGIIFTQFAKNKERYIVKSKDEFLKGHTITCVSIGVDFGGNGSKTAFVASYILDNYQMVIPFYSDRLDMKNKTSVEYREKLKEFILTVNQMCNNKLRYIFGDCADTVMINETRAVVKELRLAGTVRVLDCKKHNIKKRIDTKKALLAKGSYFICQEAETVISSTEHQVWDSREGHEDERLDNGSVDIDTADAEEYSWSFWLDKLIHRNS